MYKQTYRKDILYYESDIAYDPHPARHADHGRFRSYPELSDEGNCNSTTYLRQHYILKGVYSVIRFAVHTVRTMLTALATVGFGLTQN